VTPFFLNNIEPSRRGYAEVIRLFGKIRADLLGSIKVDMSRVTFVDASMCAPLGALLNLAKRKLTKAVELTGLRAKIRRVLSKNGFLSNFGGRALSDKWRTTIEYRRFDPQQSRAFTSYVGEQFENKGLPVMSKALRKRFFESLCEIFDNAVRHSRTQHGIFACGQLYPNHRRLHFCIADAGIGFRKNINEKTGLNLSAPQAIRWAVSARNTTRAGPVPGGLGLKLLREFIDVNGGWMVIVSDRGYYRRARKSDRFADFAASFPGAVVSVCIRTDDTRRYTLPGEVDPTSVF
jgi:hypothetical protein